MDDLKDLALRKPLMSAVMERLERDGFEKKEACDACGQCCSRFLPMTDGEKKTILDDVTSIFGSELERSNIKRQLVFYDPGSMKCPLCMEINGYKESCILYGNRPGSCIAFDCSIVMNDKPLEGLHETFIKGSRLFNSDIVRIVDMAVVVKTAEILVAIEEENKRHETKLQDRIKENIGFHKFAKLFTCDIERYVENELYSTKKSFKVYY